MAQDQTLTCKDCGNSFVFTAGEQEFYAQKGFSSPVRCKDCRDKLKQQKRMDRQMYDIICKECGQKGQVPFKPQDPTSVLCSDCFAKSRGMAPKPATKSVAKASGDEAAGSEE
jgi:CxxC-x17-CxxC domain-containing protein